MDLRGYEAAAPSSAEGLVDPSSKRATLERVVRWVAPAAVLLGVVVVLARWLRPELEGIGTAFVERFGVVGMAFGTFLADGFHFPVPPQFYMLMAIASGTSPLWPLVAITIGSLLGGTVGFFFARHLAKLRFVARWLERSSAAIQRLGSQHGYRLVIGLSLTPIAYSLLCYLAGVYRLPKRLYALLALLRVPKILLYYYLVRFGWGMG